jgi:hypothetical protein
MQVDWVIVIALIVQSEPILGVGSKQNRIRLRKFLVMDGQWSTQWFPANLRRNTSGMVSAGSEAGSAFPKIV